MYEGERTRLRRLEEKDAEIILPHWNKYELRQYLPTPLPNTHNDMVTFITTANEAFTARNQFIFGLESLDTGALFGIIGLKNISWISRNAELGIFGIFDSEYRGKGYGADGLITLLDVAFSVLDLHTIYLWVEAFNEHAIRLYEKTGFSRQGTLRELAYRDGKRCDIVVMDLLKREFIERYGTLTKVAKF